MYELNEQDSQTVYDYYLENKDKIIEYIKEVYFSSYKEILQEATKDDLIQYTLDYLAKEFNEVLYQENIYLNDLEDALYRVLDEYLCED
jgi:trans-aconitate methyltransferase